MSRESDRVLARMRSANQGFQDYLAAVRTGKKKVGKGLDNFLYACVCPYQSSDDKPFWKPYQELEAAIRDNEGKEILIGLNDVRPEDTIRYASVFAPSPRGFSRVFSKFFYGVLSGEGLKGDLKNSALVFPVRFPVRGEFNYLAGGLPDFSGTLLEPVKDRVRIPLIDLAHLQSDKFSSNPYRVRPSSSSSQVLFGDAVRGYFCGSSDPGISLQNGGPEVYQKLRVFLGSGGISGLNVSQD